MGALNFDNAILPEAALLGEAGRGFHDDECSGQRAGRYRNTGLDNTTGLEAAIDYAKA